MFEKKGVRVLGVAESFKEKKSVLTGVVIRGDLRIDGAAFSQITVGGLDATEGVLDIWRQLDRTDIHAVMLNGCVIAWFNIIDLDKVFGGTGIPVICVTYERSSGLEKDILRHFEGEEADKRLEMYRELDGRTVYKLGTGKKVFIRALGVSEKDVQKLLDKFTLQGAKPEPLRISKIVGRALINSPLIA